MARMRFNKDERAAFTAGALVEWRVGRYWYPGVIVDGTIHCGYGTHQHLVVESRHRGSGGGGVQYGERLHMSPTSIRLPNDDPCTQCGSPRSSIRHYFLDGHPFRP